MDNSYQQKYLKYKSKYEMVKKQQRGRRRHVNELEGGIPFLSGLSDYYDKTKECWDAPDKKQCKNAVEIRQLENALNKNEVDQKTALNKIDAHVKQLETLSIQIKMAIENFKNTTLNYQFVPTNKVTSDFKRAIEAMNSDGLIAERRKQSILTTNPYKKGIENIKNDFSGALDRIYNNYEVNVQRLIDQYLKEEKNMMSTQGELKLLQTNFQKTSSQLLALGGRPIVVPQVQPNVYQSIFSQASPQTVDLAQTGFAQYADINNSQIYSPPEYIDRVISTAPPIPGDPLRGGKRRKRTR